MLIQDNDFRRALVRDELRPSSVRPTAGTPRRNWDWSALRALVAAAKPTPRGVADRTPATSPELWVKRPRQAQNG